MVGHETTVGYEHHGRLLARLVRVLLAREPFDTLGDLTEALKGECARLKIHWTNEDITEAYRLIESNLPLLGGLPRATNPRRVEEREEGRPFSRDDAKAMWARLRAALVRTGEDTARDIPTMPKLRPLTNDELGQRDLRDDQRKAYLNVQQQILDTAQRVAALEAAIEAPAGDTEEKP